MAMSSLAMSIPIGGGYDSGAYTHDNSGAYTHDNSGAYMEDNTDVYNFNGENAGKNSYLSHRIINSFPRI